MILELISNGNETVNIKYICQKNSLWGSRKSYTPSMHFIISLLPICCWRQKRAEKSENQQNNIVIAKLWEIYYEWDRYIFINVYASQYKVLSLITSWENRIVRVTINGGDDIVTIAVTYLKC